MFDLIVRVPHRPQLKDAGYGGIFPLAPSLAVKKVVGRLTPLLAPLLPHLPFRHLGPSVGLTSFVAVSFQTLNNRHVMPSKAI